MGAVSYHENHYFCKMNNNRDSSNRSGHLAVYVKAGGVDTLVIDDDGYRHSSIEVDQALISPDKALEEAVYMTPWLLGDFSRIDIIASSPRFTLVPEQLADDATTVAEIADRLWPDRGDDTLETDICGCAVGLISVFDRRLSGFVGRTFTRATLHHRLSPLVNFFTSLSRPVNRVKLYAHFSGDNDLDVVALNADGPLMANTFECRDTADAVYFIMAAVKDCGLDALDDEVIVCGNTERATAATEKLRLYLNSVMPLLLPVSDSGIPIELLYFTK